MTDIWNEDASALYRRLAQVAVPDRAEQNGTVLTLLPCAAVDAVRNLGSG